MKSVFVSAFFMILIACNQKSSENSRFIHEIGEVNKPWTHQNFDNGSDKFMFAIISDLNGGERTGVFDVAVEQLNLLQPEFVLSVGDLIDGGTEDLGQLQNEWDSFDARASQLKAPFFYIGGNHDLTNLVMRDLWNDRYGPRYYHFIYKNVLFLMLDSEDYTEERMQEIYEARSEVVEALKGPEPEKAGDMLYYKMPERLTGEISDNQSIYFEEVIERYPDVRWTFLLMHKPVWQREDEGGLQRIEKALGERPYTVINGHFHRYSHHTRNDRDYIILGTTGGSQSTEDERSYDHVTVVTVSPDGPSIANLRLDGMLNKTGKIPAGGDTLCFQASVCLQE